MIDCKVKISVDICGESALDKVSKLVVDGMSVNKACKQVAEDFNAKNEGAQVKAATLRQSYIRSQKVVTCNNSTSKKLLHVTTKLEKPLVFLDIPIVSTTPNITITEEEYYSMVNRIKELEDIINDIALAESLQFQASILSEEILLERVVVYNFIKEHANPLIKLRIQDKVLPDSILFAIFLNTKSTYLDTNDSSTLPYDILNATGIKK